MTTVPTAAGDPASLAVGLCAWARRTPDRTAVRDDDGVLSFAALDALAGDLAARLRDAAGDAPHVGAIPILVGRDRWSAVAVHAALRAGLPFAPLDADLPPAVLGALCARLGDPPLAVVCDTRSRDRLPDGVVALTVGRDADAVTDAAPPAPVDPGALATVIFTSGSTGRPKGVRYGWAVWEARGAEAERLDTRHPDGSLAVVAALMPMHWTGGLGRTLAVGTGSSVTTTNRRLSDPTALVAWLRDAGVSAMSIVPALIPHLARAASGERALGSVRMLTIGGDRARWDHVAAARRLTAPDARIRSTYGASETGGLRVLQMEVGPDDELGRGSLPLGSEPVPGRMTLRAIDGDGGLHEIVAGGPIALGYLDDPQLEAASFEIGPDGRRWRTGDLVRVDGDDLYLVGRVDDVVKINGRLVAPQEAEAVIAAVPGVTEVAVVATDDPVRPRVVAHVCTDAAAGVTPEVVRAACRAGLAAHVVPQVLVHHAALPTLPTGKVDRVALRTTRVTLWRTAPAREPSGPVERHCLDEVRRLVAVDDVGPDDDLAAVGLDSMGAVELCAAIAEWGLGDLHPGDLATCRTVAEIARRVEAAPFGGASTIVRVEGAGRGAPVFVVATGGESAFGFRFLGEALGPDRPLLVVEPRGLHRRGRADRSFGAIVEHMTAEIAHAAAPGEPVVVLGFSAGGPFAFEVAQRLLAAGRAVHLVLLDAPPVLDAADPARRVVDTDAGAPASVTASATRPRRARWARARERWYARFPGRPRSDIARYRAFSRVAIDAARGHRPEPARFPVTLVVVAGSGVEAVTRPLAGDLVVHRVAGTHSSILTWPDVGVVCGIVDGVARRAHGEPAPSAGPDD